MTYSLNSTLLLTILLVIGLFFFLRASSKDRTTVIEITSSQKPVEVLNVMYEWLDLRGWNQTGGDFDQRILIFHWLDLNHGKIFQNLPLMFYIYF